MSIKIEVYGTPAPQGSKSFMGVNKVGRGILVESSKKVKPWRSDVKDAAEKYIAPRRPGWTPLDGPLLARMIFTLRKPLSAPKRRRTWPDRTPDLSKLCRSTEDALVEAGLVRDDARIIEYLRLAKVYPGEDAEALESPGATIVVYRLLDAGVELPELEVAA